MNINELKRVNEELTQRYSQAKDESSKQQLVADIYAFCLDIVSVGIDIGNETTRDWLRALLREWSSRIYELNGKTDYPRFLLSTYQPNTAKEIRRFIGSQSYFVALILGSTLLTLILIIGPIVYAKLTKPVIEIEVSEDKLLCTPGEISCLFHLNLHVQKASNRMRAYVIGRLVGTETGGWMKLSQGVQVQSLAKVEMDGRLGKLLFPISSNYTLEMVVVMFDEATNPLAIYPLGLPFDDYKSLPGLVAYSPAVLFQVITPNVGDFIPQSNPLSLGQFYGSESIFGVFQVGYNGTEQFISDRYVRLKYEASTVSFGVWGLENIGNLDALQYDALTFSTRNREKNCDFAIKLNSEHPPQSCCEAELNLNEYASLVGIDWTKVVIPLADFSQSNTELNLGSLDLVTFGFNERLGSCDIDIKDIELLQLPDTPTLPSKPSMTILSNPETIFCLRSTSVTPKCSITITGITDVKNPDLYRVFGFSNDLYKQTGKIVSFGQLNEKGEWTMEVVFPSLDVLPGKTTEIQVGLLAATSKQRQFLINKPWINNSDYESLDFLSYSEPISMRFGNPLQIVSEQLASINSARLYAYSTVTDAANFIVEPYRVNKDDSNISIRTLYRGQNSSDYGVWGIENLFEFDLSLYTALVLDTQGQGSILIKLKDLSGCETRYLLTVNSLTLKKITIPFDQLMLSGCVARTFRIGNISQIVAITFGFEGQSQSEIILDNIRFVK